jgi:lysophospholipase L1-like esterase
MDDVSDLGLRPGLVSRAPRARRAIVLLLVGASIAGALGEAILRVTWSNPYRFDLGERIVVLRQHQSLRNLEVRRGAIGERQPVLFRTDERGYVRPSRRSPDAETTIAFLGGSTTECRANPEEIRFPALVGAMLAREGRRVNTLNTGRAGTTIADSIHLLLNHVVHDRPDQVVVMHAANDIGHLRRNGGYRVTVAVGPKLLGRWLLQAASARSYLLGGLRWIALSSIPAADDPRLDALREAQAVELPVREFGEHLAAFVGVARAFGIEPVLMTQPLGASFTRLTPSWVEPRNQARFNQETRDVAAATGAQLIDLAQCLELTPSSRSPDLFYDGLHLTDFGSQCAASCIADALRDP